MAQMGKNLPAMQESMGCKESDMTERLTHIHTCKGRKQSERSVK